MHNLYSSRLALACTVPAAGAIASVVAEAAAAAATAAAAPWPEPTAHHSLRRPLTALNEDEDE